MILGERIQYLIINKNEICEQMSGLILEEKSIKI